MAIQHFDDPDRIRERQEALEVLSNVRAGTLLVRRAVLAREVAEMQRLAGREVRDLPRNFLPISQRYVETKSGTENMLEHRAKLAELPDPNAARSAAAQAAGSLLGNINWLVLTTKA